EALAKANITANKNSVPNDPRSPMITSGLRLGTPAVTTRGFKENEIEQIAHWICDILDDINNQKTIEHIKKEALDLCAKFPVYEK
ncbi:MAG TPA: serine hydroxymethyltransferase, partial [Coxiellaceae bacterium]|nr:serine hydroxymethyltransferase [Coxiellaceae bacterium]